MDIGFRISFYAVLVACALYLGLLIYLAIQYPIVFVAIVVVTMFYIRYELNNAVLLPPDVEI